MNVVCFRFVLLLCIRVGSQLVSRQMIIRFMKQVSQSSRVLVLQVLEKIIVNMLWVCIVCCLGMWKFCVSVICVGVMGVSIWCICLLLWLCIIRQCVDFGRWNSRIIVRISGSRLLSSSRLCQLNSGISFVEMNLLQVMFRLKLQNMLVISSDLRCLGVYLESRVVVLGIVVLRLRLVRKCSVSSCLMLVLQVEVRLNRLKRKIVVINISLCLQWLVSGLELRVLKIMLISVVFIIGLRLVWLMFQFWVSVGVMKFIVVVLRLSRKMIRKYSRMICYWYGESGWVLMKVCMLSCLMVGRLGLFMGWVLW